MCESRVQEYAEIAEVAQRSQRERRRLVKRTGRG